MIANVYTVTQELPCAIDEDNDFESTGVMDGNGKAFARYSDGNGAWWGPAAELAAILATDLADDSNADVFWAALEWSADEGDGAEMEAAWQAGT